VTMALRLSILATAVAFAAAGCGGDGGEEEEAAGECGTPPAAMTAAPTTLGDGFPTPEGVTYTSEEETGPSSVVEGYFDGDLDAAFEAYESALGEDGYSVTKSEHEEDDAEVNFAGAGVTGQVRLGQECSDRTTVSITSRPE
jgi:hypothetical protein